MPIVLRPPGMELAPLPDRLGQIGRARRRFAVVAGALRLLALTLVFIAAACALDVAVHLPGAVRALLLVGILSAVGAALLRWVYAPARLPTHPLAVALFLEDRFPRLNDSLASAVDFLESMPAAALNRFRRVAVRRAENLVDRHDVETVIPTGSMWRAFWLVLVIVAVFATLALLNTSRTTLALHRLADPFGKHPWPTRTRLDLLEPTPAPNGRIMLAKGEPLPIKFTVQGVLPDHAVVSIRFPGSAPVDDPVLLENPENKAALSVSHLLEAGRVPRDFEFRIAANDAVTDWHPVTVAPAPKLVPVDGRPSPMVRLTYPTYTDLPPTDLPDGTGVVEAVAGTRITFRAAADRRIVNAVFRHQADLASIRTATAAALLVSDNAIGAIAAQLLADETTADMPVRVSGPDGTLLDADFVPHLPGLYALRFTDEVGLTGVRLFDLRIFPDPAPVVGLGRPAAGRDPLALLPTASVPVMARAEDRPFAVKAISLEYRVGGPDAPLQSIPLADLDHAGQVVSALAGTVVGTPRFKPVGLEGSRFVPIAAFKKPDGTAPVDGDLITLRAAATDWDNRTALKEPGRSAEVEIRVMGKPSLEAQIQKDLSELRPDIARLLEEQRGSREKTGEVLSSAKAGQTRPADAAKLAQADQVQRQVRNRIGDPDAGLRAKAEQLRNAVRANNLPRSPTTEKVETVAEELGRIADQPLEAAEPLLNSARQEAEKPGPDGNPKPDPKALADLLAKANRQQRVAEDGLANLLERLEAWGAPGEIRGEARALKDQVNRAGQQADKAAGQIPDGKDPQALSPEEKTALTSPADKFDRAADQAGELMKKATRLADDKDAQAAALKAAATDKNQQAASQPNGSAKADALQAEAGAMQKAAEQATAEADALRNAVREAGGDLLPQDLNRAADKLRKNHSGESQQARQSAMNRLDKLADSLAEKRGESPDELRKKQRAAANEITKIGEAQDELRKKAEAAANISNPEARAEELKKLSREQERLQKEAEQLAQRLTRERQNKPADALRRAAEQMDAAREDLENGQPPADKQDEALDRLDEALKKIDQEKKDDQEQLSREKREQLLEQLKAIRDKQQAAVAEATRIHDTAAKAKGWDRPLQASLRDLEEREKSLGEELRAFAEKNLADLPVFNKLTGQSADQMDRAARFIGERLVDALDTGAYDADKEKATDAQTLRPMKTALRRLDQILDTLKEDPKAQANQQGGMGEGAGSGGAGGAGGGSDQGGGIPPLAQLKALRAMQADVNDRTAEFDKAHPDRDKLSDEEKDELKELEQSQRDVAELFNKLAELFHPAEEIP